MCGIVGYSGSKNAQEVIVSALSKLEYRGYDSSGIAIVDKNNLKSKKTKGRLTNLEKLLKQDPLKGNTGIGHTRWATHGEPSDKNAHPHYSNDNSIAVVHNGIIENYNELKKELQEEGIKFKSETDTEVIPNLIAKYYQGDLLDAVYKTTEKLKGSYALGVISKYSNNEIVAVRKDSPLIVGFKDKEAFIASDIPAILNYTKDVYFLENNDTVHIKDQKITIYDKDKNQINKKPFHVDWDITAAEKNGFSSFMEKEIHEQIQAIKETIQRKLDNKKNLNLEKINITEDTINSLNKIYITACGTAYNAGAIGKNILQDLLQIPVITDIASEFRYSKNFIDKNTMLITISQSGETADTIAALRENKNATTLAITNVIGSTIARESKNVLYTLAGPEIAVASTKAYTTQILSLYILGLYMALRKNTIDKNTYKEAIENMLNLPEKISQVLKNTNQVKEISKNLKNSKNAFYIGRGIDYHLAREGSLKLKEISYIHSEAFPSGELKHGTIALIEKNTPVIAIATDENLLDKTISNIQEVKSRGAYVITIASEEFTKIKDISDKTLYIPKTDKYLKTILVAVYMQLLALYTAQNLNLDVDKPRNLAKSVTVE